jgi:hypothetical protein
MTNLRPFVYSFAFLVGGCVSNGSGRSGGPGNASLVSFAVQPADAVVAVDNGAANAVQYAAVGTFSDGHTEPLTDATFSLDTAGQTLGMLSGPSFAASGGAAGTGHVSAASGDKTGSTSVTVTVHTAHLGMMVPSDGATHFQGTLSSGPLSAQLDYPLDGAVMPTSVKPPDVQTCTGSS